MAIEIIDRYKALGIPYPDLEIMCKGQCEGTGFIPHRKHSNDDELQMSRQDGDEILDELWEEAHKNPHKEECDGWHFLKCPDCKGTGKI